MQPFLQLLEGSWTWGEHLAVERALEEAVDRMISAINDLAEIQSRTDMDKPTVIT